MDAAAAKVRALAAATAANDTPPAAAAAAAAATAAAAAAAAAAVEGDADDDDDASADDDSVAAATAAASAEGVNKYSDADIDAEVEKRLMGGSSGGGGGVLQDLVAKSTALEQAQVEAEAVAEQKYAKNRANGGGGGKRRRQRNAAARASIGAQNTSDAAAKKPRLTAAAAAAAAATANAVNAKASPSLSFDQYVALFAANPQQYLFLPLAAIVGCFLCSALVYFAFRHFTRSKRRGGKNRRNHPAARTRGFNAPV
jgi:hypothetical protein